MNCRGRNSIKYYRELTKANRNESKVTHVSAKVNLGKKGKNQRQLVNDTHPIKCRPSDGPNMANGSYRKKVVANISG